MVEDLALDRADPVVVAAHRHAHRLVQGQVARQLAYVRLVILDEMKSRHRGHLEGIEIGLG
ncbi:hypothetical protein OMR07_30225 [Methylobacterium organophilum]|nr:hypothetical protein [Methylobacterium organophilum]